MVKLNKHCLLNILINLIKNRIDYGGTKRMKLRKYLFILCVFLVVIGVSSTVSALKIEELGDTSVVIHEGKSIVTTHVTPDFSQSASKQRKELNKINKIIVKINGKTVNTIKKGKGWKKYEPFNSEYYPEIIDRTTILKKNLKGKTLGVYLYNNKNKLIKWKISKIKPKHISKVKITKKQAIEETKRIEKADIYPVKITNAVFKKGRFEIPYYWRVTFTVPPKNLNKHYVYIDAIDGDTFNEDVNYV